MTNQAPLLPPGFRFHPTDEELILFYLKNRAEATPCPVSIIAEVDIYKFDPWNLPDKAMFGDKEWYFFTPRDRKYPNGVRPNRAAGSGYWKATGTDKPIVTTIGNENIGVKKALVFYIGKPPKGVKTNWIMHEYRLSESNTKSSNNIARPTRIRNSSMRLDDWVLCRIYQKGGHTKEDSVENESSFEDNKHEIQRTFSLTELLNEADFSLLSRFIETPVDTGMPSANMNATTYAKAEPSVFVNGLKRQRAEEGENSMYPLKRNTGNNSSWDYMNFGDDQYDSQTFYDQQLLMNPQFGMQ